MEPITLILTALALGGGLVAKKTVEEATKDSYEAIKKLIAQKFSGKPEAQMALTKYEEKPKIWEAPLKDALIEVSADKDEEIMTMTKHLMEKIEPQHLAMGKYNVQTSGEIQGLVQGEQVRVTMNFDNSVKSQSSGKEILSKEERDILEVAHHKNGDIYVDSIQNFGEDIIDLPIKDYDTDYQSSYG